jgi:DNA-binding CsgD family transcriptional regulator
MARRMNDGTTLAELTRIVTDESRPLFDSHSASIELLGRDGRPEHAADSCDWLPSAALAAYGRSAYRRDPLLAHVVETHMPATGGEGRGPFCSLIAPIVGGGALTGALRLFRSPRYPRSILPDISVISAHLSAIAARLGLGGAPMPRLTIRQTHVADLTRAGYGNREIGDALGISVHAVKKHLAHLFDRLHVSNRTELAALVARHGPRHDDGARHHIRVTSFVRARARR